MASVFNRGSKHRPLWYVKYRDLDGRWKMIPSHMPTKEQARRFVEQIVARISNGKVGIVEPTQEDVTQQRLTVKDLGERFIKEYCSPRVKDIERYRQMVGYLFRKHVFPSLGHYRISEVSRAQLNRLRDDKLSAGLSNQSVKHVLAYLSRMFNWAREEEIISVDNVTEMVDKPSVAGRENDFDYLSKDEVLALLKWSEENQPKEFPLYAMAVYTGMRIGELYGLRWIDINMELGLISVRRSYRSTPKSGKSRRIPINPILAPILRRYSDSHPASDEGLVFPSKTGVMRNKDREYGFKDALTGAKCHAVRFHSLRHTFASHFIMTGGNILTLQRLLGHSSVSVTMKYAHLAPDFMRQEISRMSFVQIPADVVSMDEARAAREAATPEPASAVA